VELLLPKEELVPREVDVGLDDLLPKPKELFIRDPRDRLELEEDDLPNEDPLLEDDEDEGLAQLERELEERELP